MNKLLERILDIISNDAFPDEDKPYIIREVVSSWNEAKDPVPSAANETWYDEKFVNARIDLAFNRGLQQKAQEDWDRGYQEGYAKGELDTRNRFSTHDEAYQNGYQADKQSACDLQQRELDAKWDAGYLNRAFSLGKNAGYEERKKHVQVNQDHFYNKGHAEGYQKGLDEKAMQHVTDIFTVRKESKEEGYQKGYIDGHNYGYDNGHVDGLEKGRSEQDEHLSELQSNWHRRGYNEGIAAGRQEFHRHAAERYRAGVEDSRNEIVGIINNLRTPE